MAAPPGDDQGPVRDAEDAKQAAAWQLDKAAKPHDAFTSEADEILPFLWLGAEGAAEAPAACLRSHGITHILVPADTGHEWSR